MPGEIIERRPSLEDSEARPAREQREHQHREARLQPLGREVAAVKVAAVGLGVPARLELGERLGMAREARLEGADHRQQFVRRQR